MSRNIQVFLIKHTTILVFLISLAVALLAGCSSDGITSNPYDARFKDFTDVKPLSKGFSRLDQYFEGDAVIFFYVTGPCPDTTYVRIDSNDAAVWQYSYNNGFLDSMLNVQSLRRNVWYRIKMTPGDHSFGIGIRNNDWATGKRRWGASDTLVFRCQ